MKKTIFIALGVIAALLIIGIWVYLFIYGAPKNVGDIFGDLGDDGTAEFEPGDTPTEDTDVDAGSGKRNALRQITIRPVAGAMLTENGMRYVERGTGHIYDVSLYGSDELLVSNTTVPQTVGARFSPDAESVILTTERGGETETIVATIEGGQALDGVSLPSGAKNAAWEGRGETVYYTLPQSGGSAGYSYDPLTQKSVPIFQIPLRDIEMLWGSTTYAYTTPTARQIGYIYTVSPKGLSFVTTGSPGLMATPYTKGIVVTKRTDGVLSASIPNKTQTLPFPLIPQKCTSVTTASSTLYCGGTLGTIPGEYPDDWYKGEQSFVDLLWKINPETGEGTILSNLLNESGREIDIVDIGTDDNGYYIYFVNKNDGALWLFDTTVE